MGQLNQEKKGLKKKADNGQKLDPKKNKTVFMNLIHIDENAQVTLYVSRLSLTICMHRQQQ